MQRILVSFLLACAGAWGQAGQQQQPQPAEEPQAAPIRIQVNEVIVPVTVTDEKDRFVSNLDRADFKVYEDGKEQEIRFFSRERSQPVVIGFILDMSNSTRLHWKTFQEAVLELVWALMPGDKKFSGFLVTSATEAEIAVKTSQDSEKIVDKIRKMKPGGGSAIYDAVYLACTRTDLVQGEPIEPRRVLVVIGDGDDNASKHTLDQVIEIAQRSLVTVYAVSTSAFGFASPGAKNLERLANETGGRVEYPLEGVYKDVDGHLSKPSDEGNYAIKVGTGGYASEIAKNIFASVANITGEITTQYILRYVTSHVDDPMKFRNVRVDVPKLANVKVRTRRGYYPYQQQK
jgi:VWFA-related protein